MLRSAGVGWRRSFRLTVNPEVAGSNPVEPAKLTASYRTPQAAPVVNVTQNVTAESGRRVSEDF